MQIHLSPRHLTLTAAIHGYVAEKIHHLENIAENIVAAHVVLIHDGKKKSDQTYCVKVHLAVPGPDIHAEALDADLYASIDAVYDKLARQLRKRKTRLVDQKKHKHQKKLERAKGSKA
jgi:putative sigma-54 modulation protein